MCCFLGGSIEIVADTRIFARATNGKQVLVYSMTYATAADVVMVLPLPVALPARDDAVRFIDLEDYPDFFAEMNEGFPRITGASRAVATSLVFMETAAPPLVVHDVGSFEASFVPSPKDFDRLDQRFRFPAELWERMPEYKDYGFAVFKLKPSKSELDVHPMAFEFPRRDTTRLFFPTVHVHDGLLHPEAEYDHVLYAQYDALNGRHGWQESMRTARGFMDVKRAKGILDPRKPCFRHFVKGRRENADTWVGPTDSFPKWLGVPGGIPWPVG